ncbi:MAG: response regulator transcription factor [Sedimentibacter sp.]
MEKDMILIVDDEKDIRDLIDIFLKNEGYNVVKASNGIEALDIVKKYGVDLIILDIMMPQMNGIDACIKIREISNIPIIMLSARNEDMDKIYGLTTGADDYLEKPFNPLELLARVKSQLRRYYKLNKYEDKKDNLIEIDNLTIDADTHEVRIEDKIINLTAREFDILLFLARNRGMVFSTEKLYEKIWNDEFFDSDNTVMVHIRNIREKIEEIPKKPRFIKTIWGVGYKIEK